MKLSKRLQYSYDLVNSKFYIFDPLLNIYYQYTSGSTITLEDTLSDYDTEKISNLNITFMSLDEFIKHILDKPEIMPLIGYQYEIWGYHSQDDLIVQCYEITYEDKVYTLQDKTLSKYKIDRCEYLFWPDDLVEQLNDIYST